MKKFKEILFLKNLKRVGNAAVNGKYNKILTESNHLDELIIKLQNIESKFSDEDLQLAKSKAEEDFEIILNSNVTVITIFDENYPKQLNVMKNSKPAVLYVKGNVEALNKPNIAVIGTRNPSDLSRDFEINLVKKLITIDKVIVSGLALGCDAIAHKTTVDENKITIAILPSWVENITPASNKKIAENILKTGGCLISEYGPNTKVYKSNYVNRDKIVAAFSDATFVVECGIKSGTMKTVKEALKFKKPIYSYIPSQIPEECFEGNQVIVEKNNAIKVEDIDDFILNIDSSIKKESNTVQMKFE